MKKKIGLLFLVIAMVLSLTSCKEKHIKYYIENEGEKYYSDTYDENKVNYFSCNKKINSYSDKTIKKGIFFGVDSFGDQRYVNNHIIESEMIYDVQLEYNWEDDAVKFEAGLELAYIFITHSPNDENDSFWLDDLSCTMLFENDEPRLYYKAYQYLDDVYVKERNPVTLYDTYFKSVYDYDIPREHYEKLNEQIYAAMLKCKEEALRVEVKEEPYYVNVSLYKWYNPWGKVIIWSLVGLGFISLLGIIMWLMSHLPDSKPE